MVAQTEAQAEAIVSSLELQISLFFHCRFSIVHVLILIIMQWQWQSRFEFQAMSAALWSVVEACRLYLGYAGNLGEQVPHLFGFLFLSVFPQAMLLVFIMALQWRHGANAVCIVMNCLQMAFTCSQLLFGSGAIRAVIRSQTEKFKRKTRRKTQKLLSE